MLLIDIPSIDLFTLVVGSAQESPDSHVDKGPPTHASLISFFEGGGNQIMRSYHKILFH